MLLGSFAINMDAKGRIAIPQRFRDELVELCGGRVVATAHTEEHCLLIYPEPQWSTLQTEVERLPNINDRKIRRMQRLLLGYATPLDVDGNGRVLLPPTLREYARLEKKLMLVGQGRKLELWNEDHWNQWIDAVGEDDSMPDEVLSLSL